MLRFITLLLLMKFRDFFSPFSICSSFRSFRFFELRNFYFFLKSFINIKSLNVATIAKSTLIFFPMDDGSISTWIFLEPEKIRQPCRNSSSNLAQYLLVTIASHCLLHKFHAYPIFQKQDHLQDKHLNLTGNWKSC